LPCAAAPSGEREALHAQLAADHERIAGGVGRAMDIGVVDEVVEPSKTRARLSEALAAQRDAVLGGRYPELKDWFAELSSLRMQIGQKTLAGPGPHHAFDLDGVSAKQIQLAVNNAPTFLRIDIVSNHAD
jgi:hypothetical protein